MLAALAQFWRDPVLRLIAAATMLFGAVVSSLEPYKSLLGIGVFGLSDQGYALMLVASLLVSVMASVGVGIVTDQRGNRRAMALVSGLAVVLGCGLVWVAPGTGTYVTAHMVLLPVSGALVGQLYAITRLYVADRPAPERDTLTSAVRALFAVPFVVMLPIWGAVFDAGLPLTTLYPALTALGGVLTLLILRRWPADHATPWTETASGIGFVASVREILRGKVVWPLVAMGFVQSGSVMMAILLALLFDAAEARAPGDVGRFFGAFVFFEIIVMLNVGRLLGRVRRLHVICAGAVIYACYLALLPVLAPSPFVWLLIAPAALGGGMMYGLSISYLQDLLGSRAGAGASLVTLQRMVSEGAGAALFALGAWVAGYGLAAILGSLCVLSGTIWLLWLDAQAR